jgi:hypothetical protein
VLFSFAIKKSTIELALAVSISLAGIAIGLSPSRSIANDTVTDTDLACDASPGLWLRVPAGEKVPRLVIFDELAKKSTILLGETHDNADHHRWQLNTIAALHSRVDKVVLGFEMFPRHLQAVLDRWVRGELSERAFLVAVDWERIWGFDARHYLPLFHFARMNGIPMIALNVDRKLVTKVGAEGWDAVPLQEREGLSDPAPASSAYLRSLANVYGDKLASKQSPHQSDARTTDKESAPTSADTSEVMTRPDFKRFVEAQLTWDRAMLKSGSASATLIAARRPAAPAPTMMTSFVFGIMTSVPVPFGP